MRPGPEVINLFSSSTQLSMKIFLLINVKMPTIVDILTFMNRKTSILGLSETEKSITQYKGIENLVEHGSLSCSSKFSMILWTEILKTET